MIRTSRVCAAGIYPILPGDTPTWLKLSGGPMVVTRDLKSMEGGKEDFGIPVFRESGRFSWKGSKGMGKYAQKEYPGLKRQDILAFIRYEQEIVRSERVYSTTAQGKITG